MSRPKLNDMLTNHRHMEVADDELISVSEGRIRIRIGVFIFMSMLVLIILRLAEVSLFGDRSGGGILPQAITTKCWQQRCKLIHSMQNPGKSGIWKKLHANWLLRDRI